MAGELATVSWADLTAWRDRSYRRRPDLKLHTERQARQFVDDVGFCFLFTAPGVEMPSLWEAINGRSREIPHHHYDHALGLAWSWKDSLPESRAVWYGKLLRDKPMFVSLEILPAFYALSENFGGLDDYRQQFADGRMSVEARDVYEALLAEGPLSTNVMRKQTGLYGKGAIAQRFERAVVELQRDLKIVKCGTSQDNRWKYCYVYDLLLRRYPDVAEAARAISGREARRLVVGRYLENAGAAQLPAMQRLFGWDAGLLPQAADDLLAEGRAREVTVSDVPAAVAKPRARRPAGEEAWLGAAGLVG